MTRAVSESDGKILENTASFCEVRLDRLVLNGTPNNCGHTFGLIGFKRLRDHRVRRQGKIPTYSRVCVFRSVVGDAQVVLQYEPVARWLQPWRLTITGDDRTGITTTQIEAVLALCLNYKLSLVELAFDFAAESGVDERFVLQHGTFGKSRRRLDRGGEGQIRYGGRNCPKLVRCYQKKEVDRFRVELEIHPALLRKYAVSKVNDFGRLCPKLLRSHVRFVGISWRRLSRVLEKRFGSRHPVMLEEAKDRALVSLRRVLRFLKRNGVTNPHRFLHNMRINDDMRAALRAWAEHFSWDRWD